VTKRAIKSRPRRGAAARKAARPPKVKDAEHREPLADARIRPLLERYVEAADAELTEVGDGLFELHVPLPDRSAFQKRSTIRVAFTLDAFEHDPDAEIAVVGSPLVEQLVTAIRARGSRCFRGFLPPELQPSSDSGPLRIVVTNGTASKPRARVARHRVLRLLARVVVSAGSTVEEHLIESGYFDAVTGSVLPADVAARCEERRGPSSTTKRRTSAKSDVPLEPSRSAAEIVSIALADLRASFEPNVHKLRDDARIALEAELQRIDGYYSALIAGGGRSPEASGDSAKRAYEAEHARRRAEEERRHRVRVVVHPVQLTEWELLVERAEWEIGSAGEQRGRLVAARWLNGGGEWSLACPGCAAANPKSVCVCRSGHVACDACAATCTVCNETFCRDHGAAACHVDGAPTCAEHSRTCSSCGESHCAAHEATCVNGDHAACSDCVAECASCGRAVCDDHSSVTSDDASRGARRLCADCLCHCEGGANELVGRDEVTQCATCGSAVCETHRATCAVDQHVHCSRHLRRTGESGRLVCESHVAHCAFETDAVHAADEVTPCASCGRAACAQHSHECVEDGERYCDEHSLILRGEGGRFACQEHAKICNVDRAAYPVDQMTACPVCDKWACTSHSRECSWCGRSVCLHDFSTRLSRCMTCARLTALNEPPEHLVAAVASLLKERTLPKQWRTGRDAHHTVVEVTVGFKRRVVFVVRHGETAASDARSHSIAGSKGLSVER
jgi:hypothetical protein